MAHLQGLLDERGRQLAGREAEAAQQAQCIAVLEQRIRALLGQLEEAQAAAAAGAAHRGGCGGWKGGPGGRRCSDVISAAGWKQMPAPCLLQPALPYLPTPQAS